MAEHKKSIVNQSIDTITHHADTLDSCALFIRKMSSFKRMRNGGMVLVLSGAPVSIFGYYGFSMIWGTLDSLMTEMTQ